jgi:phenylacetate-CoA ligase
MPPQINALLYMIPDMFQMAGTLRGSPALLERARLRLFQAQMAAIYEHIPYYGRLFDRLCIRPSDFRSLKDIRKLPVLSKKDIKDDTGNFLNKNIKPQQYYRSFTSGSTGEPFMSFFDKRSWIRKKYLSKLRARFVCGMRPFEKVAIFESAHPETTAAMNTLVLAKNPFLRVIFFSIFSDMGHLMDQLFEFKPQNAYGPPSFFIEMARRLKKMQIVPAFLKTIYTSAEYQENGVFQYIREVFKADVFDIYGTTEFKEIAWECGHHTGYHVNEDELFCEILKGDEPAAPGEIGDIVLTDLRNTAMPLIRYRIQDRGMLLQRRCGCGIPFTLIRPVAGRASEYIILPNGEKIPPYLLTSSIEKCSGLLQYQIVQKTATEIVIEAVPGIDAGEDLLQMLRKKMNRATKGMMNVSVKLTGRIENEDNGKFRVVKNEFANDPKI